MRDKLYCFRCMTALKNETEKILSKTYPLFCPNCDENMFWFEAVDKDGVAIQLQSTSPPWRIVPIHYVGREDAKHEHTRCGIKRKATWMPWLWQVGIDHSWDKITCKNCLKLR